LPQVIPGRWTVAVDASPKRQPGNTIQARLFRAVTPMAGKDVHLRRQSRARHDRPHGSQPQARGVSAGSKEGTAQHSRLRPHTSWFCIAEMPGLLR
jgi:hypothetical protein